MSKCLVIGMGNPLRGDDGAGPAALKLLEVKADPGLQCITTRGEGLDLIELWSGQHAVIVIDAVQSGALAGTLHRFEVHDAPVPIALFGRSTHSVSLAESVELARALGQLPKRLLLYGIEAESFTLGDAMTDVVNGAIPVLVQRIWNDIKKAGYELTNSLPPWPPLSDGDLRQTLTGEPHA